MKSILRAAVTLGAALLLGNAAPDDTGTICVGGRGWRPSLADAAAIEAVPVPASYRILLESTAPCVRWGLDKESLVDLHLRFGSERSISAALAYLERDHMRGLPPPGRYAADLQRAWRSALPDLRLANALPQPEGLSYSVAFRSIETSRPVQKLLSLVRARDNYLFLAEQPLRAAEEFGSLPLLDKANPYLVAAVESARILDSLANGEPAARLVSLNLNALRTEDLQVREAILRARLSRSEADLARAETILQALERPTYRRQAEAAYSEGDHFCDIADGWGDAEKLRNACGEDVTLKERVTNYWINRAMLDFISDVPGRRSDELALRLLQRENMAESGRCCRRRADEDLLRLRLGRADHLRRRLAAALAAGDESGVGQSWHGALEDLREAERLAPVESSPGRFRRIAATWLEVWQSGDTLFTSREPGVAWMNSPERWRYATYLRRLISHVDMIAAGADAGVRPQAN